MKKLTAGVLVALMVAMGAALATAAKLPQALKGVDLSTAQVLTPDQAQQVKGTAAPDTPPPGLLQTTNAYPGLITAGTHVYNNGNGIIAFSNSRVFGNGPFP